MTLTTYIGDSKTFSLPLRWGNKAFVPGDEWGLIFTVKADEAHTDEQAKIQKSSVREAGISISGSTALVSLVPQDTNDTTPLAPETYYWDIQAQRIASPNDVRTVAKGRLVLVRDVTRLTTSSIPIHTTNPPYPGAGGAASGNVDGGEPDSNYTGVSGIDGGTP
jgi:hypothetical protein